MRLSQQLTQQHRDCDAQYSQSEAAVAKEVWQEAKERFDDFSDKTLQHFHYEEQHLFPAFEAATGITEGPTKVMRYEHEQIHKLIDKMKEALEQEDKEVFLSLGESMMILLQQHNMKEEQMLYRMCEMQLPRESYEAVLKVLEQGA